MASLPNLGKLLWRGAEEIIEEGNEADQAKAGVLRGGNSGLLEWEGDEPIFINQCPRLVYLRYAGYSYKITPERIRVERMFEAGRNNEDGFVRRLEKAWKGGMLREEAVGLSWDTSEGVTVTCRPDIILTDKEGKPVYGIENKRISSLWTGLKVNFKTEPKLNHVIQSAHYSMKMGDLPYDLWYTADCNFQLPSHYSYIPKQGEPGSEFCRYRDDGNAFSVDLTEVGYQLQWQKDGSLKLRKVSDTGELGKTFKTIVTQKKILDFYSFMGQYVTDGVVADYLPPLSSLKNLNIHGRKEGFTLCQYCELREVCPKAGNSLKKFIGLAEQAGYYQS